jgi:membrane carboxypeptidase/penicillin-binding protein PbpC
VARENAPAEWVNLAKRDGLEPGALQAQREAADAAEQVKQPQSHASSLRPFLRAAALTRRDSIQSSISSRRHLSDVPSRIASGKPRDFDSTSRT